MTHFSHSLLNNSTYFCLTLVRHNKIKKLSAFILTIFSILPHISYYGVKTWFNFQWLELFVLYTVLHLPEQVWCVLRYNKVRPPGQNVVWWGMVWLGETILCTHSCNIVLRGGHQQGAGHLLVAVLQHLLVVLYLDLHHVVRRVVVCGVRALAVDVAHTTLHAGHVGQAVPGT